MGYNLGQHFAVSGEVIEMGSVEPNEKKLYDELIEDSKSATSWKHFQELTARKTVELVKKYAEKNKSDWYDHVLVTVRMDLLRRVGIRTGELPGEISDKVSE
jgi:hypothetical protein